MNKKSATGNADEAAMQKKTVVRRKNRIGVRKSTPVGVTEPGKNLDVFAQDKFNQVTITDEEEDCLSPKLIEWCKRQRSSEMRTRPTS